MAGDPPPSSAVPPTSTMNEKEYASGLIPTRTMSTFGFVPADIPCGASQRGSQSEASPSITIPIGPDGTEGPRIGSRSMAIVTTGLRYTFHFPAFASRASRADPRPFVKPEPFVRPFVSPDRWELIPFTRPFVLPRRPFTRPFVLPRRPFTRPFVLPRRPFTRPFVRPRVPFTSPFVRPRVPFTSPFVRPRVPFTSPFVRPRVPLTSPFVLPRTPFTRPFVRPVLRGGSFARPFVRPRFSPLRCGIARGSTF